MDRRTGGRPLPRRRRRGLIEATPSWRAPGPGRPHFRGGVAAASLKQNSIIMVSMFLRDFRGGVAAASLKRRGQDQRVQGLSSLPRRRRRGLIEAVWEI